MGFKPFHFPHEFDVNISQRNKLKRERDKA